MKNADKWIPSKYILHKGKLRASRDPKEVRIFSRLNTDLIAAHYDKTLKLYAKGRLLDLGCGKVPLYEAYKNYVTSIICVDWEHSVHKNPYLDFEADLNNDLAFSNDVFDTVILSDVLEHIRYPEKLISEIIRVLKCGGVLFMNVPFYYWLHEQPYDYFRYTRYALESMASNAGFKIITLEEYGGAPEIMADLFAKNIQKVKVIGKLAAILSQKVAAAMLKTGIGEKLSKVTSSRFPLGYFMVAEKVC